MRETPGLDRTALVLGVNGQDGSYLAESLLASGWKVTGIGRQSHVSPMLVGQKIKYIPLDLADIVSYEQVLIEDQPDVIFHSAAIHGANNYSYEAVWKEAHLVNTMCAHAALEYLRTAKNNGKLIYFSSSKVFDLSKRRVVDESSRRRSTCIYTATKNCATDLITYYRNKYSVAASVVWFFNHESPRRSINYFIPTIVGILAKSLADSTYKCPVKSLDFWCDWGDAAEYMSIIVDLVDNLPGDDLIMATGVTCWARNFVSQLFAKYGLDYKQHVQTESCIAPNPNNKWRANIGRLRGKYGRPPTLTVLDVCSKILSSNYHILI